MQEIWKDVVGYEGKYQISDLGRVKSFIGTEKILKQQKSKLGYMYIILCNKNVQKRFAVHRLVATAFIPNLDNKKEVNHINEIRWDNRLLNLEWITRTENVNHGSCSERSAKTRSKKVKQIFDNGFKIYNSINDAARDNGINPLGISNCCNHKRKIYCGYKWEFA